MKSSVAFCVLIAVAVAAAENTIADSSKAEDLFCYAQVNAACSSKTNPKGTKETTVCNSRFGAMTKDESVEHILRDLQTYVNTHITRSYEYLMIATHYANFEMNRPGFEKLFRSLADEKWNSALGLIEYITKRGGVMDFDQFNDLGSEPNTVSAYELYELQSVAKALDIEKKLTKEANTIHHEVLSKNKSVHDSEMSHYIEEAFTEKQAETIRRLSGYATDLTALLSSNTDASLALYLFDEYLQKQ